MVKKRTQRIDVQHLQTNKRSKTCKGEKEDLISQLPDDIVQHILSLIPLKCAVRTSILSNRWKELWKSTWIYTANLNFGEEFEGGKDIFHVSRLINRLLQIHRGNTIEIFRLYFSPAECFLPDIQRWIGFAVEKRVKHLHLDFTRELPIESGFHDWIELPPCLFSCDSLTILELCTCKLNVPSEFRGFGSLKTLRLRRVETTACVVDRMLLKCPMLKELALIWCGLQSMKCSATDLKIKNFTLADYLGWQQVESILYKIAHLQILTILDSNLPEEWSATLPNLTNLRLIVHSGKYLARVYAFLTNWKFPCLKKLRVGWTAFSSQDVMVPPPSSQVFQCLKTVKIAAFYDSDKQMEMVKFLLEKAVVLETMVLVTPDEHMKSLLRKKGYPRYRRASLRLLYKQLLLLPKASTNARIVLEEH